MSLINDALKRAKQAQQKNPTPSQPTPPPPPLYRPVQSAPPHGGNAWFLPVVIVLLLAAGIFCICLALFKHPTEINSVSSPTTTTNTVETVANAPAAINATPDTNAAPISNVVAVSQLPPPKVQGIFFDPTHPWAIVGGKTVYVGDHVRDMRVYAISQNSITLVGNGETNELFLGE
jgi:hypothetical protein